MPPAPISQPQGSLGAAGALADALFREVRPDFFRVLCGGNASVYVDILDALEAESSQRNEGMTREEALAMVADALSRHPDFQPEAAGADAEAAALLTARDKARYVLDYFVSTGWLEAQTGADWHRSIHFNPHGTTLMGALRRMAHPEAAVFTDKLVGVCAALGNSAELARQPWEHVQACRDQTQQGLGELRGMQKSVERYIRRQVEAQSLGENLSVVFDQYAEQVGHTCYAELVRAQLSARLGSAKDSLQGLLLDSDLLHRMQAEVLRRDRELDAAAAMTRVRRQLDDLARAIESVLPLADAIDARTAEFTRRSLARFRYLQEVVGERRGQVKALFERVNKAAAGRRFADLDELPELPSFALAEARLLCGRDSLYEPPRRRTVEENQPVEDEAEEALRDRTRRQMESALRDQLTVARANRFVEQLPGGKGHRVASGDLPVRNEDDLADLISLLLHAESADARYRVEVPGAAEGGDSVEHDLMAACRVERFFVVKK